MKCEQTKYEFTGETIDFKGRTLYRIRALRDFGSVKRGDLGGYIETVENLGLDDTSWVADEAKAFDNARVMDGALLSGNAIIKDGAKLFGNASAFEDVEISGKSHVFGNARLQRWAKVMDAASVSGSAWVFDMAIVKDSAVITGDNIAISGNAIVGGEAFVWNNTEISNNAQVVGKSRIQDATVKGQSVVITDLSGNVYLSGNSLVSSQKDWLTITGLGDGKTISLVREDKSVVLNSAGCTGLALSPNNLTEHFKMSAKECQVVMLLARTHFNIKSPDASLSL